MGGSKLQKFLTVRHIPTPLGATTGLASSTRLTLEHIQTRKNTAPPELWSTFTARKSDSRVQWAREILRSEDDENYVTHEPVTKPIRIHVDEEAIATSFEHACRLRNLEFAPNDPALEDVILSRHAFEEAVEAERMLVEATEKTMTTRELVTGHTFKWIVPARSNSLHALPVQPPNDIVLKHGRRHV
ncbi:Aste57867_2478 [Aphanomyces stellatus]|uniref:Aste57867_2478 protein n=1 Tax=Aphanomyces stellatus TaxID=120398 RepID=A0A485KBW9_9STRA|nr:hypothetical protein As57867_002472 [Aphanomyces stellatus]VFT79677.1 Aste57867_2478 [Aphanomyces stellatus]